MSPKTIQLTDALHDYILGVSLREPELLCRLREETQAMPAAIMQISPEQGQLMRLLVQLMNSRRAIEVGVFTGYSSLSVMLAMPDDATLLACDVNEEYTAIARRYWEEAGVADRIELVLAPASETLAARIEAGQAGTYDFAFIDADKSGYDTYYEQCLTLLRSGGLIVVDNVLWSGAVADPSNTSEDTQAIRALNEKVGRDARVSLSLVPIGDGVLLVRKH